MRIEEIGATRVWVKGDGAAFLLHPECFNDLWQAWDNFCLGSFHRFYHGKDIYGDRLIIKLADVVALNLTTPEGQAMARRDSDEQRQDEVLS